MQTVLRMFGYFYKKKNPFWNLAIKIPSILKADPKHPNIVEARFVWVSTVHFLSKNTSIFDVKYIYICPMFKYSDTHKVK